MSTGEKVEQPQEPKELDRVGRRAICATCPSRVAGLTATCLHCGCVILIMTNFKGRCPQHKW